MKNINKLQCPSCGETLEGFERNNLDEYSKRLEKYKEGFEDQMLEQERKHRAEIQYLKKMHSIQLKLIHPSKAEAIETGDEQ